MGLWRGPEVWVKELAGKGGDVQWAVGALTSKFCGGAVIGGAR
jgi:hypothetical protein